MIVAFCACPWRLEAPGCWVCALATASDPSTNTAAAKVIVIFRIRFLLSGGDERQTRTRTLQHRDNARILPDSGIGGESAECGFYDELPFVLWPYFLRSR